MVRRVLAGTAAAGLPPASVLVALALVGGAVPTTAQGPAEWCPEPEARQFDFWIGEWDVANRNSRPGSPAWHATGRATDRVYAVVGGCAVVEHWRGYAFPSAGHVVGFSVRAWDPEAGHWDLVLLWPMGGPPSFGHLEGEFREGRGDFSRRFVNARGDSVINRVSFWKVRNDSFQWNNAYSRDGGMSWDSSWIMEFARRPPTASGLWNGQTMTTDRCPGPEHRTLDRYLGEWTGTRVEAEGDSVAVRTRLVRILQGCAIRERTRAEDGHWARFAVRAYEPGQGHWVAYALASDRRTLHRRVAESAADTLVLTDAEAIDGAYRRTRWLLDAEGLRRLEEEASEPDGPWRAVAESRFPTRVAAPAGNPQ